MQKTPPDGRLTYISEVVFLQGATVRYTTLTDGPAGWMIHVFEPGLPKRPPALLRVLEVEVDDPRHRARLRGEIASLYRARFLD
ncbi:hypothetical protein [Dietzia alimentaria]|uniref:hypothetical protein n=1 Tax=Dietzia alimentaria TaxID=665550 RepID=UPI00029A3236|nr:hypothetical protein [Dietzia alimentaria]